MFTGIVEACGRIADSEMREAQQAVRLRIEHPGTGRLQEIRTGDSIAVNGVCLTACKVEQGAFCADLGPATMARTTLMSLVPANAPVNLEPALRAGDPMGGHLVSGHVDATAAIAYIKERGEGRELEIRPPAQLRRYLAPRGSVCVDGVSLTIAEVREEGFRVALIPHTCEVTVAADYRLQQRVNLEVDLLARYIEQLLEERRDA